MHQKMTLGMEVGLSPGDFVLDGTQLPLPYRGTVPQFSVNVLCGQTTGWTKMALGMDRDRPRPSRLFDGDPATPRTEGTPTTTQFLAHVYCGQAAGWMKAPLGTEVDLDRPRPHCIRRGPTSARNGHRRAPAPIFLAHVSCGHGRPPQLLLSSC